MSQKLHKVFLAGVSFDFKEQDLYDLFCKTYHSIVSIDLVKQKKNKRLNKGCGFMEILDPKELAHLLRTEKFYLKGREFSVKEYKSGEELQKSKEDLKRRRLFLRHVDKKVTNEHLRSFFGGLVELEDAYLVKTEKFNKFSKERKRIKNRQKGGKVVAEKAGRDLRHGYLVLVRSRDADKLLGKGVFVVNGCEVTVERFSQKKHERMIKRLEGGPGDRDKLAGGSTNEAGGLEIPKDPKSQQFLYKQSDSEMALQRLETGRGEFIGYHNHTQSRAGRQSLQKKPSKVGFCSQPKSRNQPQRSTRGLPLDGGYAQETPEMDDMAEKSPREGVFKGNKNLKNNNFLGKLRADWQDSEYHGYHWRAEDPQNRLQTSFRVMESGFAEISPSPKKEADLAKKQVRSTAERRKEHNRGLRVAQNEFSFVQGRESTHRISAQKMLYGWQRDDNGSPQGSRHHEREPRTLKTLRNGLIHETPKTQFFDLKFQNSAHTEAYFSRNAAHEIPERPRARRISPYVPQIAKSLKEVFLSFKDNKRIQANHNRSNLRIQMGMAPRRFF